MRRRRDPVPRAHHPWGWLGGILILGVLMAGAVSAALALWENIDIRRLTRAPGDAQLVTLPDPSSPPSPAVAVADSAFQVTLYSSEATAGYFPQREYYPAVLDRWRDLASEAGAVVRTVGSPSEVEAMDGRGLVVAPSAVCLGDGEIRALRHHAERGGGLLLTWATGARDEHCEWRGWEVVQDFTEALDVRELDQREGVFLSIPSSLPLSSGIEPAARVELRWDSPLALATTGTRIYWSDWALNPSPAAGTEDVDAAAALRTLKGGGRIAWFGFTANAAVGPLDKARVARLLTNGLLWGAGIPVAEMMPWPRGSQSALVLAQELSGELGNVRYLAEAAAERKVPATYFVVSQLTRDHPEISELLEQSGEVASQTSDNSPLAGLPEPEQQTRLRRSVSELRSWTGSEPVGLRAPEESADEETLRAWRSLGGTYVVGLNSGRTASPEVFELADGPLVLLPRAIKDDYNLLVQERVMRSPDVAAEFMAGIEKLRALGGLSVLTVNSQLSATERHVGAISTVLDSIRSEEGWWFATGADVAEWSLARRETSVEASRDEEGRVGLVVRAPADRPLRGGWIEVTLPEGSEGWEAVVDSVPVAYGESAWGLVIPLDDLEPGEARTVILQRAPDEGSP